MIGKSTRLFDNFRRFSFLFYSDPDWEDIRRRVVNTLADVHLKPLLPDDINNG
jgi:hypothetical protein